MHLSILITVSAILAALGASADRQPDPVPGQNPDDMLQRPRWPRPPHKDEPFTCMVTPDCPWEGEVIKARDHFQPMNETFCNTESTCTRSQF